MKKYFLYLFLGMLLAFSSCVNDMKEVNAISSKSDSARIEKASNIKTYYYGTNGMLKGVMTAPTLLRYMTDTPYMKLPDGLKVKFYKDSLQLQSILTAKKGVYFENSNNITVKDSVVVTTREGKKLETKILHWDPKKQQFYTHKPVKLTTPSQIIYGKNGLTAPPDLSWYRFNNASGNIRVDTSFTSPTPRNTKTDSSQKNRGAPPKKPKTQKTDTLKKSKSSKS